MELNILTSSSTLPSSRPQTYFPPRNCTSFYPLQPELCVCVPKGTAEHFSILEKLLVAPAEPQSCRMWLRLSPTAGIASAGTSCTGLQHGPLTLISGTLLLWEKIPFNCHSSFVWILLLNEQLSCSKLLLKSRQSGENAGGEF